MRVPYEVKKVQNACQTRNGTGAGGQLARGACQRLGSAFVDRGVDTPRSPSFV